MLTDIEIIELINTEAIPDIRIIKRYKDNEDRDYVIVFKNDDLFNTSMILYQVTDELIMQQEIHLALFEEKLVYDLSEDNLILLTYDMCNNKGKPYVVCRIHTREETHEDFTDDNEIFKIPSKYIENFSTVIEDGKLIINKEESIEIRYENN